MSAHTPGPWTVDYQRSYDEIVGPKNESVAQTGSWREVEKPEQHANARLIAASPELYALAKRIASLNPDAGEIGAGMLRTIVSEAVAAVAKVEGK